MSFWAGYRKDSPDSSVDVFDGSNGLKVLRSDTRLRPTEVVDMQSFRDRAPGNLICKPVG